MSDRPSLDLGGPTPDPTPIADPSPAGSPGPGASGNGPGPGPDSGGRRSGPRRPRRGIVSRMNFIPALIMIAVICVAFFLYLPVRDSRVGPEPKQFEPKGMAASYEAPANWKTKQQKGVAKGSGRWAVGPAGAKDKALFVTRYPLDRKPDGDDDEKLLKKEVETRLGETGAGKINKLEDAKIDGKKAWVYSYTAKSKSLNITTWAVLDDKVLYQFSCQAPSSPAAKRKQLQEGCDQVLKSWSFKN